MGLLRRHTLHTSYPHSFYMARCTCQLHTNCTSALPCTASVPGLTRRKPPIEMDLKSNGGSPKLMSGNKPGHLDCSWDMFWPLVGPEESWCIVLLVRPVSLAETLATESGVGPRGGCIPIAVSSTFSSVSGDAGNWLRSTFCSKRTFLTCSLHVSASCSCNCAAACTR